MSVTFTLASAAILAGITLSSATSVAVINKFTDGDMDMDEPIETMFKDCDLLYKTLTEYGCDVTLVNENEIVVGTQNGKMKYVRENASLPFGLIINNISNSEEFFENLKSFEQDYGRNVQEYTYNHVKENLTNSMTIEKEEVTEDDCLVITINV